MSRPDSLYQWTQELTTRLPRLSRCQVGVLAEFSYAMTIAQSCGLSACALSLYLLLGQKYDAVRQRLREFYLGAARKKGQHRTEIDPTLCFEALLKWVTDGWTEKRLAIALDPTHLKDTFITLSLSALYRGCAIPVAWKIIPAEQKGGWNAHWKQLLETLRGQLGPEWTVVVLSDRGLESRELFEMIQAVGWHPLMRVKKVGHFRPNGWANFVLMPRLCAKVGDRFVATGHAYKTKKSSLECTLMACWDAGHEAAWLILTDLAPGNASACWYAFRAWIEQGFKVFKRAGWQWQNTRMTDPVRAERLWLVVSVATLWLVALGGVASQEIACETIATLRLKHGKKGRLHRLFRIGLIYLDVLCRRGQWHPIPQLEPQAWPEIEPPPPCPSETEWRLNQ